MLGVSMQFIHAMARVAVAVICGESHAPPWRENTTPISFRKTVSVPNFGRQGEGVCRRSAEAQRFFFSKDFRKDPAAVQVLRRPGGPGPILPLNVFQYNTLSSLCLCASVASTYFAASVPIRRATQRMPLASRRWKPGFFHAVASCPLW